MACSILVVDDEEKVLKALKRELESTKRYRLTLLQSPEIALVRAKEQRYDLVISDYNMPWMHGLTFIKRFAKLQPHAANIVITGDAQSALRHSRFNDHNIPHLLEKPWQQVQLLAMVERVLSV